MYKVAWVDYCGNKHEKIYKHAGTAIKKCFQVSGWYKNGECVNLKDNRKVL